MRHLLNPLDFTVEEIDELLAVAHDIEQNLPSMPMSAMAKNWRPVFMSPVPVHA